MKQTLISRLVMGALVGVAATASFAGQIQSSSLSIAREVITTDTQAINAPTISYRFNGDVNALTQSQQFQIQFTLEGGAEWATAGDAASISLIPQAGAGAGTALVNGTDYTVDTVALSADKTTLFATITVVQGKIAGQPLITVSTAAVKPTINKLFTVVKAISECDDAVKTLPVSVKHFTALTSPSSLATDTNATPDEHLRPGSTNRATLITFPTNLKVAVQKSLGNAKIKVSTGSTQFDGTPGVLDAQFNAPSFISGTLANLGNVRINQNAAGYDSNLTNAYLTSTGGGLSGIATAAVNNGKVELEKFSVKVSASQGFVEGGQLYLVAKADALTGANPIGTVNITAANKSGPITVEVPTAAIAATFGATGADPVYVIYKAPGTAIIPGSSFNIDEARAKKAAAGANLNEQDNYCKGVIYPLSGSVKIDVRNYASNARTDGWLSVLRLINPSETRTIDVYGQYIHNDGLYGKWGKVATLKPRAVLNLTPDVVDSKLTSAPAHATGANNATAAVGTSGDAPRLRLTTEQGDTLRVQNYLYNPASKNFIEASGSQGVDFTGNTDRAPLNEGQYTEQDAQVGLNGGN